MTTWKRKLKTELCILFNFSLVTQIFLSISNCSKVFEHLPIRFLQYSYTVFPNFPNKQFFSWLCRFKYTLGQYFFIYHSWYTSNFEATYKKRPFFKVAIFPDAVLASNYHGCKEEAIKWIPYYMVDIIHKTVKPSPFK